MHFSTQLCTGQLASGLKACSLTNAAACMSSLLLWQEQNWVSSCERSDSTLNGSKQVYK